MVIDPKVNFCSRYTTLFLFMTVKFQTHHELGCSSKGKQPIVGMALKLLGWEQIWSSRLYSNKERDVAHPTMNNHVYWSQMAIDYWWWWWRDGDGDHDDDHDPLMMITTDMLRILASKPKDTAGHWPLSIVFALISWGLQGVFLGPFKIAVYGCMWIWLPTLATNRQLSHHFSTRTCPLIRTAQVAVPFSHGTYTTSDRRLHLSMWHTGNSTYIHLYTWYIYTWTANETWY